MAKVYEARSDPQWASTPVTTRVFNTQDEAERYADDLEATGSKGDVVTVRECEGWEGKVIRRVKLDRVGPRYKLTRFQLEGGWTIEKLRGQ